MSDREKMGNPNENLEGLNPADLLRQGAEDDTLVERLPTFEPPSLEELAEIFPAFEILELIGQGGMGAVYKVRQRDLERVAALKILPPVVGEEPGFAERFMREAKALARLNHSGIVTLYEFGEAKGLYFFLMEFVDGMNLKQLLSGERISSREALAIVPQICDALQFAHDQGIVHRDIKPENLLIDRRGNVKVADFGVAKVVGYDEAVGTSSSIEGDLTVMGKVMGTPEYMAPEQVEKPSAVDHRADIYALGVVFYQMLTGELPGKELQAPSRRVTLDVRLDEVVLRALEKDPARRYADVTQLKTMVETASEKKGAASRSSDSFFLRILAVSFLLFLMVCGGAMLLYSLLQSQDDEVNVPKEEVPFVVDDKRKELQEELLERILNFSSLLGSDLGPNHPEVRLAEAELKTFEKLNPGLRDEKFRELVKERKNALLVEIDGIRASGHGKNHPKVRSLDKASERLQRIVSPLQSTESKELLPSPEILIVDLVSTKSGSVQGEVLTAAELDDWSLGVYEVQDTDGITGEVIESRLFLLTGADSFGLGMIPLDFDFPYDVSPTPMVYAESIGDGLSSIQIGSVETEKRWHYFEMRLVDGSLATGLLRVIEKNNVNVLEWRLHRVTSAADEGQQTVKGRMDLVITEDGTIRLRGRAISYAELGEELKGLNKRRGERGKASVMITASHKAEFRVLKEVLSLCSDEKVSVTMVGTGPIPILRSLAWQHQVKACVGSSWSVDGSHLSDDAWLPPIAQVDYEDPDDEQRNARFLCLAFSHEDFDETSVAEIELRDSESGEPLKVPVGDLAVRRIASSEENGDTGWVVATVCAGTKGRISRKVKIDLRYSLGRSEYLGEISPSYSGTKTLGGGWFTKGPAQDAEDNAFVEISRSNVEGRAKVQIEVVAIQHDGQRLERQSWSSSGSRGADLERIGFGRSLSEIRSFEFRSRPIHKISFPAVLLSDDLPADKMPIKLDRAGKRMQGILFDLRRDYGVHVCFEELDFDHEKDAITLGSRLERLTLEDKRRDLTKTEEELLGHALKLRNEKGLGLETIVDVGQRYDGVIEADSVDEFLEEITRGTDYEWKRIDGSDSWVVKPRGSSRLNYEVSFSTEGLTVEEAINEVANQSPESSKIHQMEVMIGPVGVGADPAPYKHVACVADEFEKIPAWRALSKITKEATPDSIWGLVGYKNHRFLSLGRSANDSHRVIGEGQAWLIGVDRGEFEESWEKAAHSLRARNDREKWLGMMKRERLPVVEVIRRKLVEAKVVELADGARSMALVFDSSFLERGRKRELLTMSLEADGQWRVSSYEIR